MLRMVILGGTGARFPAGCRRSAGSTAAGVSMEAGCHYVPQRLRRLEEPMDVESSSLGHCDCTSYSYFALSLALFGVGTVITVLALGDAHGRVFSSLGHMWLVGPIFISSGLMIAVKSVIYLRKKSLLQMIVRQRALIRDLQELARQSRNQACMMRNVSAMTLPPSYDSVVGPTVEAGGGGDGSGAPGVGAAVGGGGGAEAPPPTYEEAVFLLGEDKWKCCSSSVEEETKMTTQCSVEEEKCEDAQDPICSKPLDP